MLGDCSSGPQFGPGHQKSHGEPALLGKVLELQTHEMRVLDGFLFSEVVGQSHLDSSIEDQEIVTNPPDICQVVEVTTESDEQPMSMSELYPLQISPVSSYAGTWAPGKSGDGAQGKETLLHPP